MRTVSQRIMRKVDRAGYQVVRTEHETRLRATCAQVFDLQRRIFDVEAERDRWHARYDAVIKATADDVG